MSLGTYECGGLEVDLDRFPPAVVIGFVRRTIAHKLGNEVASAIIRVKDKYAVDNGGATMPEEDVDAEVMRMREAMVAKFYDGTVGLRVGGPRGSTIENIAFELAMKQAQETLEPKGAWPKPDKKNGVKAEDATVVFAGEPHTREMLADLVLDKYRDQLMAKAKVVHEERMEKAKAAKAAAVPVKAKVEESAADLL